MIDLVLVDDEKDLLTLLTIRFELEEDLRVIGTASNGEEAVEACRRLRPDLVVMDLMMPGTDGYEAVARLREEMPELAIVAYSAVVGELASRRMGRYGVPLVLKQGDSQPLIDAIRQQVEMH